jgi:FAD/FMN-containing dehydrogenase
VVLKTPAFDSATGITGLTLGAGIGYLTRRWGWTSDTVVGMDLVTAEGRVVRASAGENADLFWGLRGGGGNFGVVTGIDYTLGRDPVPARRGVEPTRAGTLARRQP